MNYWRFKRFFKWWNIFRSLPSSNVAFAPFQQTENTYLFLLILILILIYLFLKTWRTSRIKYLKIRHYNITLYINEILHTLFCPKNFLSILFVWMDELGSNIWYYYFITVLFLYYYFNTYIKNRIGIHITKSIIFYSTT